MDDDPVSPQEAQPNGLSVELRRARGNGRGVFAVRPIPAGAVVLTFGGARLARDRIADFTHTLEVADGVFLGPSGGVDDYVNHACEPNCAVFVEGDAVVLRAVRDVAAGEQVTMDYSLTMITDPTAFECRCGAPRCRGRVQPFPRLPAALRREYARRGLVPDWVVRRERRAASGK
jgi:hypothetical protein